VTRPEFENLRDLPDKTIVEDIQFGATGETSPVLVFENVRVRNSLGLDLRLNGKYNPLVPSLVFNFRILDVGPICRLCINGTMHSGTRTHKHSLESEEDPRRNLPIVVPRPDLQNLTPSQIWDRLCAEAKINHVGQFVVP
jgi:hypothetical protein